MNRHSTARMAAPLLALALSLTACGGSGSSTDTSSTRAQSAQIVDGIAVAHNDADVTFIGDMTPHHEGAVAMAELAPTRAENPEVKDLAARIAGAQGPELELMKKMAGAWEVDLASLAQGGGHSSGGSHGSSGMGTGMAGGMDEDTAALEPLKGAAFDKEFLTRMIAHHEGALPMAQAEVDGGDNPQAKELATTILTTQKAEITEMKALLAA